MAMLDEVLRFIEERIDPEHIAGVRNAIKKALCYERCEAPVVKIAFPNARFACYPYRDAFDDMEKMMANELVAGNLTSPANYVELRDHTVPMIRADYGAGTLPSLFGIRYRLLDGAKPWAEPAESPDQIRSIIDRGIPDLYSGLGRKVFDTYAFYREKLRGFPKCESSLAFYHPDIQGPFDVAHLIWGSNIYYALYDEPETVHTLLKLVTETYIKFLKAFKELAGDENGGYVYQWGTLYKGGVVLRDDTAVNLSCEQYDEFVKPYDERILKEFGGGSIHYCGHGLQWLGSMIDSDGMKALNFGQPPNMAFGFDFLERIHPVLRSRQTAVVDYGIGKELIDELDRSPFRRGITYSVSAGGIEEARSLRRHLRER